MPERHGASKGGGLPPRPSFKPPVVRRALGPNKPPKSHRRYAVRVEAMGPGGGGDDGADTAEEVCGGRGDEHRGSGWGRTTEQG